MPLISPALVGRFFTTSVPWEAHWVTQFKKKSLLSQKKFLIPKKVEFQHDNLEPHGERLESLAYDN